MIMLNIDAYTRIEKRKKIQFMNRIIISPRSHLTSGFQHQVVQVKDVNKQKCLQGTQYSESLD